MIRLTRKELFLLSTHCTYEGAHSLSEVKRKTGYTCFMQWMTLNKNIIGY